MQYIGEARELIFEGLRRLIKVDGRVGTSYYRLREGPVRSLWLWSSTGRRGTMPTEFAEVGVLGDALFGVLDEGAVYQPRRMNGENGRLKGGKGLTEITPDHPILAIAPVWSRAKPVGMLFVDVPAESEVAEEDLYLVDLFAKLLGLLTTLSDRFASIEGASND
jgi:hypothetical protein